MWVKGINSKPDLKGRSHSSAFLQSFTSQSRVRGGNSQYCHRAAGTSRLPIPHLGRDVMQWRCSTSWYLLSSHTRSQLCVKPTTIAPQTWVSVSMHLVEIMPPSLSSSWHWPAHALGSSFLHTLSSGRNFHPLAFTHKAHLFLDVVPNSLHVPSSCRAHVLSRWNAEETLRGTACLAAGISSEGNHGVSQVCCNCPGKGLSKAAVLQMLLLRDIRYVSS